MDFERILNGPRTEAERTVHYTFRFMYVRTYYARVTIKFYVRTYDAGIGH